MPTLLEISTPSTPINQPNVVIVKDDENTLFNENNLLKTVSKPHVKKAQILLNAINQRSSELSWNLDGTIIINQIPIPNSNIFEIFRYLFLRNKKINAVGFIYLVDKIQLMGLTHLITVRHRVLKHKEPSLIVKKDPNFWFLG